MLYGESIGLILVENGVKIPISHELDTLIERKQNKGKRVLIKEFF